MLLLAISLREGAYWSCTVKFKLVAFFFAGRVINASCLAYTCTESKCKEDNPMIDTVSLLLTIIGGINWLLVGVFQF